MRDEDDRYEAHVEDAMANGRPWNKPKPRILVLPDTPENRAKYGKPLDDTVGAGNQPVVKVSAPSSGGVVAAPSEEKGGQNK